MKKKMYFWKAAEIISKASTILSGAYLVDLVRDVNTLPIGVAVAAVLGAMILTIVLLEMIVYSDRQVRRCIYQIKKAEQMEENAREVKMAKWSGMLITLNNNR